MIVSRDNLDGLTPRQLTGFFEGWPDSPSPETHLHILQGSAYVLLALDDEIGVVVIPIHPYRLRCMRAVKEPYDPLKSRSNL